MLLNESPNGNTVVDAAESEAPSVITRTAGTMQQLFLEDCGIPEGFDVHVSVQGRAEVHSVHLDDACTFIGRDEECGVRLAGPEVGRHHACLQAVAGQFVVIDLGSRTGVRQNGRGVRTCLLSSGGTFEVGPYTIRVVASGAEFHDPPGEAEIQRSNPPIALEFLNQSKPIDPWTLETPITLIGSAKPCRIRLEHSTVTPQHCSIIRGFRNWWIVDLNSQAGTVVDGAPITCSPLRIGAHLQVGRYQISICLPKNAPCVEAAAVLDEGRVHLPEPRQPEPVQTPSVVNILPAGTLSTSGQGAPAQVVNEHLVVELFKEFAALHERTVSQMQQSFRELLEIATANRPALAAPQAPAPVDTASVIAAPVESPPPAEIEEEVEASLTDLMHSDDPEERAAAQELLAAQMRSLEAKLLKERDGFAKRLLRSLSLTK
ncbi:MAG TPA: FHA domain-containing protein [Caulifigura sp.]|nr:FHA domain-containing protein [Caulifigura sp.]